MHVQFTMTYLIFKAAYVCKNFVDLSNLTMTTNSLLCNLNHYS